MAAIEPGSLPAEFHELEPYEIEDVLCIFKDILERERIKTVKVTPQESDVR